MNLALRRSAIKVMTPHTGSVLEVKGHHSTYRQLLTLLGVKGHDRTNELRVTFEPPCTFCLTFEPTRRAGVTFDPKHSKQLPIVCVVMTFDPKHSMITAR